MPLGRCAAGPTPASSYSGTAGIVCAPPAGDPHALRCRSWLPLSALLIAVPSAQAASCRVGAGLASAPEHRPQPPLGSRKSCPIHTNLSMGEKATAPAKGYLPKPGPEGQGD